MGLGRTRSLHYNGNKIKPTTILRFEVGMSRGETDGQPLTLMRETGILAPDPGSSVPLLVPVKRPVLSASTAEWHDWLIKRGHPTYRTRQVLDWVIHRRAESFELMSNLPKSLRQQLDAHWLIFTTSIAYQDVAPDGTKN